MDTMAKARLPPLSSKEDADISTSKNQFEHLYKSKDTREVQPLAPLTTVRARPSWLCPVGGLVLGGVGSTSQGRWVGMPARLNAYKYAMPLKCRMRLGHMPDGQPSP